MIDIQRLRTVLAVDAVGTVLLGVAVTLRPGLLRAAVSDVGALALLRSDGTARRVGVAVAAFGTAKGLLYAGLLARDGDRAVD